MAVTPEPKAKPGADEEGRAEGGDRSQPDCVALVEEVLDRGEHLGRAADPKRREEIRHHEGREA